MFTPIQLYQLESWFQTNNELEPGRAGLFGFVLNVHPMRVEIWFRNKLLLENLRKKLLEDSKVRKSDKELKSEKNARKRQGKRKIREEPKPDDQGDQDVDQIPPLNFEEGDRPWWEDIY